MIVLESEDKNIKVAFTNLAEDNITLWLIKSGKEYLLLFRECGNPPFYKKANSIYIEWKDNSLLELPCV